MRNIEVERLGLRKRQQGFPELLVTLRLRRKYLAGRIGLPEHEPAAGDSAGSCGIGSWVKGFDQADHSMAGSLSSCFLHEAEPDGMSRISVSPWTCAVTIKAPNQFVHVQRGCRGLGFNWELISSPLEISKTPLLKDIGSSAYFGLNAKTRTVLKRRSVAASIIFNTRTAGQVNAVISPVIHQLGAVVVMLSRPISYSVVFLS